MSLDMFDDMEALFREEVEPKQEWLDLYESIKSDLIGMGLTMERPVIHVAFGCRSLN